MFRVFVRPLKATLCRFRRIHPVRDRCQRVRERGPRSRVKDLEPEYEFLGIILLILLSCLKIFRPSCS